MTPCVITDWTSLSFENMLSPSQFFKVMGTAQTKVKSTRGHLLPLDGKQLTAKMSSFA
jgi:hypothetical protein